MGSTAPDFTLFTADGAARSRDEILNAGPALFAVYKASCPTCQLTLPFLSRLEGGPIQIFAVSQDSPEVAERFAREFDAPLPVLFDRAADNYPASNAWGITHVPTMFLVEPGGAVSWTSVGFFKRDLEKLAKTIHMEIFRPDEIVPEAKSG
ncbi:MAG: TlpA family protein disulfide reductase [Planctomycetaceae bacterium]|nr:TlpA family protein disulfide reductase [Planctomycetaceae bacterium]